LIIYFTVGQLYRESIARLKEIEYDVWRASLTGMNRGPFETTTANYEEIVKLQKAIVEETAFIVHHHEIPQKDEMGSFWDLVIWFAEL